MMLIVRFIHFMGSALWIGGAVTAMVLAFGARRESVEVRLGLFRLLTQVQTLVIGLGALLTVGTGIVWSMWLVQDGGEAGTHSIGLWLMQGLGLLGAVLVLFVAVPTAVKVGGLAVATDDGQVLPAFEYLRRRQVLVSSAATILAILSLFTGVVL
jgi:hypothetical protein